MSPNRADRILGEWSAVAGTATRPPSPADSLGPRTTGLGISLAGAGLLALALVVALAWLSGRDERSNAGDTTPPSANATPSPEASAAVIPDPSSTPAPSQNPCVRLAAPLTWEGAAGQRIAHVKLINRSDTDCLMGEFERVQYVDGGNVVLIEGPAAPGFLTVPGHSSVSTLIEIGNYCGPAPEQPVGITFTYASGGVLIVGSPKTQEELSVPPCNGPNDPATIEMQPWIPSDE